MKIIKKSLFAIVTLCIVACGTQVQPEGNRAEKAKEKKTDSIKTAIHLPMDLSDLWNTLPLKSYPIIDSTNFENIKDNKKYTAEEIKSLQISSIYPELFKEGHNFKVIPAYKINLSKEFYSVVVNLYKGEHELEAILINYNSSNESLIDFKTIAYDEIAEGWSRIFSTIEDQYITTYNEFYGDEYKIDTTKFHINRNGEINQIRTKFKSKLRPKEMVLLNKSYTDTLVFIEYNDDGDYPFLVGEKGDNTVSLNYNMDWQSNAQYDFKTGERIEIRWEMDSIWIAGEGETLDFTERLLDAKSIAQENKSVKFLWRKNEYSEELKEEVNTLIINESFIDSMSNQEKAALGYISFHIGNECSWDGEVNETRSNLKCKILTSLDLGYQCSDKQLTFLREWFSQDLKATENLKSCGTMPNTATVQSTFDEISILTDKDNHTITIDYKAYGVNLRESSKWNWTQTDQFEYGLDHLTLIHSEKSELIYETFQISEN